MLSLSAHEYKDNLEKGKEKLKSKYFWKWLLSGKYFFQEFHYSINKHFYEYFVTGITAVTESRYTLNGINQEEGRVEI